MSLFSDRLMGGQLVVRKETTNEGVLLSLSGDVDLASAPVLEQALREVEASHPDRVLIDLSGVYFMDSTGLRTLLLAQGRSQSNHGALRLRRPPKQVKRLLELTRSVDAFTFDD